MKDLDLLKAIELSHLLWRHHRKRAILGRTTMGVTVFHILAESTLKDVAVTMKSLAPEVAGGSSVLRRLIRDMEESGLVKSMRYENDSRVRTVEPTEYFMKEIHSLAEAYHNHLNSHYS